MLCHIDRILLDKSHAFRQKQRFLHLSPAEGESGRQPSETIYDAMTGNHARSGINVQSVSHRARRAGSGAHSRDLPVSSHISDGNLTDDIVYSVKKVILILFHNYLFVFKIDINTSEGTSTEPMLLMRFLPSFCFSSSFFFRVISPP